MCRLLLPGRVRRRNVCRVQAFVNSDPFRHSRSFLLGNAASQSPNIIQSQRNHQRAAPHNEARQPANARPPAASVPIVRLHIAAACEPPRVPGHIISQDTLDTAADRADTGGNTTDTHADPHDESSGCDSVGGPR
jgi:hypothetical protein